MAIDNLSQLPQRIGAFVLKLTYATPDLQEFVVVELLVTGNRTMPSPAHHSFAIQFHSITLYMTKTLLPFVVTFANIKP